ncbi:hypothetical protein G1K66_12475 [Tenacibaculum finnmarkense]|uniref:hypothetical protein n=1 Tax=Tenacibaculum finnmarkense TaxID=2781243 RepID=UPI001E5784F7|nr:hypothetical protein [Tenacibaculum finnmarkense]MCD8401367.1 hypothetical protein [Tenacibaculum finnmarkense genomovar ulcerans]MCG8814072.1 hypothetical protein [Tenacibaculum finnmarkense]
MELSGKYLFNYTRFKDCSFLIEYGRIHNLEVSVVPIENEFKLPKNSSDFELLKFQSQKALTPFGYNYFIKYLDESDTEHRISIKLNRFQLFKLEWQLKKYLIQDKGFKLNALKTLIVSFFSLISFGIGIIYESQKEPNILQKINPQRKEIIISSKINNTDSEKDTEIINGRSLQKEDSVLSKKKRTYQYE